MKLFIDVERSIEQGELLYSQVQHCFYIKYSIRKAIQGCIEIKGELSDKLKEQLDTSMYITSKELYLVCVGSVDNETVHMGVTSSPWVLVREVSNNTNDAFLL